MLHGCRVPASPLHNSVLGENCVMPEVPTLVAQLQSGSADAKAEAAATLQNLAANADNQVAIAKEEGALLALVALVRNGSAVGKKNAAAALQNLAVNADNKVAIAKEQGALEQIANGLPLAPSVTMWPASGVEPGATDTSNGAPPPSLTKPPVPPPPLQQPARNLNKATALREARKEARQRYDARRSGMKVVYRVSSS